MDHDSFASSLKRIKHDARSARHETLRIRDKSAGLAVVSFFRSYLAACREALQHFNYSQAPSIAFQWPPGASPSLRANFNRALALQLVDGFSFDESPLQLPRSVKERYLYELDRIVRQIDRVSDDLYDFGRDEFRKDIALITHDLIPVGAEVAEMNVAIPKGYLLRGGVVRAFSNTWFVLTSAKGFRPYLFLHVHRLSLDEFNCVGWARTYRRLADLLAANPSIKGWLGASWLIDPQLGQISPRHAHFHEYARVVGGRLLFLSEDLEGKSGALERSETRRRMFAEGRYVPRTYMRVLPSQNVIDWHAAKEDR